MNEYLSSIVKPLLQEPEALNIVQTVDERGALLTMDVASKDMGRIIGKEGSHLRKIRDLIGLYGLFHEARISVKLNEPINSNYHKV